MKIHFKSLLIYLLVCILIVGMAASCTSDKTPSAYEAKSLLSSNSEAIGDNETDSIFQRLINLNENDVLFIIDDQEVTAGYFCYWISYIIENYYDGEIDWTQEVDGQLMPDYIKNVVKEVVAIQLVAEKVAKAKGIQLSDEDLANIETKIDYYINYYGQAAFNEAVENGTIQESEFTEAEKKEWMENAGLSKFNEILTSMAVTMDGYRAVCKGDLYSKYLVNLLFYNGGTYEPTDEDIETYIQQNNIFCAKQIFISTTDAEGNPLTENDKADALASAEDILEQIHNSEVPLTTFDNLMNEYSQDTGLTAYPNGYVYTKGSMLDEFEETVETLSEGEISDIVESQYGYHIILRQSADNDSTRTSYIQYCYEKLLNDWLMGAVIEETEAFALINIQDFYEELTSIRTELGL